MAVAIDIPQAASLSQPLQALALGNAVRIEKAKLHRAVHRGEVSIFDLLIDPPRIIGSVPIVKLLQWAPGIGHVKARLVLRGITPDMNIPLRHLGEPRRTAIVERMHSGITSGFTGLLE